MREADEKILRSVNVEDLLRPIFDAISYLMRGWRWSDVENFGQTLGDIEIGEYGVIEIARGIADLLEDEGVADAIGVLLADDGMTEGVADIIEIIGAYGKQLEPERWMG